MAEEKDILKEITSQEYEHGFVTDVEQEFIPKGLDEDIIRLISAKKEEPQWLLDFRLDAFRIQEGRTLIADMLNRVDKIKASISEIEPFESSRIDTIRARILDGLASIGVEANDNSRLEQEMIFYLEKLDITEEKVRLANHCKYFHEVAEGEEAPGRKLGFIAQEMGREVNTLGSKANNCDIQRIVVHMKDELEKIKEQVLNLL